MPRQLTLAERTMLDCRYDGTIPAHMLECRTQNEMQADNEKAMIRFHQSRLAEFQRSLAKLMADPVRDLIWIDMTEKTIKFHEDEIARHGALLEALS